MTNAFTLAEVLIVLGIIGLIADMTIPTLINNINNLQYKSGYKKSYSDISQVFMTLLNDNEYSDYLKYMAGSCDAEGKNCTPSPGVSDEDRAKQNEIGKSNFKALATKFKTIKTCFDNDAEKCMECRGEVPSPEATTCNKSNYAFLDAAGRSWYMYTYNEPVFLVDINGFKKPNKLGQDRFPYIYAGTKNQVGYGKAVKILPAFNYDMTTLHTRWCHYPPCNYHSWLYD